MKNMRKKGPKNPDKLPPHSPEAEKSLLSCVMLSPDPVLSECEEGGLQPEWFYDLRYQLLWGVLKAQGKDGKGLDVVSVMERLKNEGTLGQVGGVPELMAVMDYAPTSANWSYYFDIVKEKYQLRLMLKAAVEMQERVYEFEGEIEAILVEAETAVLGLRTIGETTSEKHIKQILGEEVVPDLENYVRGKAQIRGLTTGIEYFDKLTGGIGGEDDFVWVMAARPGTGKTSLLLDFAEWIALHHKWWDGEQELEGVPVGIFSMEMTRKALGKRMLFQKARADLQRWRTGYAKNEDLPPLMKAVGDLARAPIWVDDTSRLNIESAKARARRMHRTKKIKLFMWDYLQLMRGSAKRFRPDRVQELAEVTGEFQALGKELKVPSIILAQMNRDYEKSPKWRPPQMSDLKDCGAIEQDADGIVFLYEPKDEDADAFEEVMRQVYPELFRGEHPDWSKCPRRVNLLVEKSRFGPRGICQLLFHPASTHFEDWNVWLKRHGLKAPAAGEKKPKKKEKKSPIEGEDADY